MKKIGVISLLLVSVTFSFAQDIHWSQFNDNPIFQNPGNAGMFQGDARFYANYRDQWRSVTVPFSTFSISGDGKLKKLPKLGLGGVFFHDVAGDGRFRTIELQANVNYELNLSKDNIHSIRPGINIGLNHRQLNADAFYFDNQYNGTQYDPSLPTGETFSSDKKSNFSVGAGVVYQWNIEKRKKITAGIGAFNLNRPNQGFFNQKISREIRFNIFGKGQFKIHFDWDILPEMQLNVQGKYFELMLGGRAKYILKDRLNEYLALYFGAYYRNQDAAVISLGADYQNWFAGLSYDLNFSKLVPASRVRGGIEFSLRYILFHLKPKKNIHRICPDYI